MFDAKEWVKQMSKFDIPLAILGHVFAPHVLAKMQQTNQDIIIIIYSTSLKFTIFIIYYTWGFRHCWSWPYAGCVSHMNLEKWPSTPQVSHTCSSVVRAPTSIWKAMGSIPIGDSEFCLCPMLVTNERIIFMIYSPDWKELCHGDFADFWSKLFWN